MKKILTLILVISGLIGCFTFVSASEPVSTPPPDTSIGPIEDIVPEPEIEDDLSIYVPPIIPAEPEKEIEEAKSDNSKLLIIGTVGLLGVGATGAYIYKKK